MTGDAADRHLGDRARADADRDSEQDRAAALVVDRKAALQVLGGDHEFLASLLESALLEVSELRTKLVSALETQDRDARRLAHTIKGAARTVFAVRLVALAGKIEQAAAEGRFADAQELLPQLGKEINELGDEISSHRD